MSWLRVAGAFGFLGVAAGAFGAHALRDRLSERALSAWNTGVLYHLLHAVALLALALYGNATASKVSAPAAAMSAGIVLFSGSLYVLALSGIGAFGMVTPIGGLCFLAGWLAVLRLARPGSRP